MRARRRALGRGASVDYTECGGLWVMTMFAPPTKADMLLARPTLAALWSEMPKGFSTLTWVLPEAGYRMDGDTREAAAAITREFDAALRCQATLIPGRGFQAATVRAIIAGLDTMSRSTGPKKVFSDLAPSVDWCLALAPVPSDVPAGDITAQLALLREELRR